MSQKESGGLSLNSAGGQRYLCFSMGQEEYAIDLLRVKEVIAKAETTPVPFTPPHFLGIINLRGQVISIVDLREKFGIKKAEKSEEAIVICDLGTFTLGVVVDSVNSVLAIANDDLAPTPEIDSKQSTEYITGVYRKGDKLVLVMDISKTFSKEERAYASSNNNDVEKASA